ncbi:expressed unknown protein [Seminavis robusta]|uniref:PTM/DIR17-like Tudor domain-containing protein n=1 Tax=Seminavis robusta TaxID=568900 RepID=A0A9N8F244_9STRA|nr:expressed unknown protein [Seminavis robusta]|eukprot:Sro2429_g327410.1 n/a (1298) ;mRNA; f:7648-11541
MASHHQNRVGALTLIPFLEESAFAGILGQERERPSLLVQVMSFVPNGKLPPRMMIHDGNCSVLAFLTSEASQRSVRDNTMSDSQPEDFDGTPEKGCILRIQDYKWTTKRMIAQDNSTELCLAIEGKVINLGGHGIGLRQKIVDIHDTTRVKQAMLSIHQDVPTLQANLKRQSPQKGGNSESPERNTTTERGFVDEDGNGLGSVGDMLMDQTELVEASEESQAATTLTSVDKEGAPLVDGEKLPTNPGNPDLFDRILENGGETIQEDLPASPDNEEDTPLGQLEGLLLNQQETDKILNTVEGDRSASPNNEEDMPLGQVEGLLMNQEESDKYDKIVNTVEGDQSTSRSPDSEEETPLGQVEGLLMNQQGTDKYDKIVSTVEGDQSTSRSPDSEEETPLGQVEGLLMNQEEADQYYRVVEIAGVQAQQEELLDDEPSETHPQQGGASAASSSETQHSAKEKRNLTETAEQRDVSAIGWQLYDEAGKVTRHASDVEEMQDLMARALDIHEQSVDVGGSDEKMDDEDDAAGVADSRKVNNKPADRSPGAGLVGEAPRTVAAAATTRAAKRINPYRKRSQNGTPRKAVDPEKTQKLPENPVERIPTGPHIEHLMASPTNGLSQPRGISDMLCSDNSDDEESDVEGDKGNANDKSVHRQSSQGEKASSIELIPDSRQERRDEAHAKVSATSCDKTRSNRHGDTADPMTEGSNTKSAGTDRGGKPPADCETSGSKEPSFATEDVEAASHTDPITQSGDDKGQPTAHTNAESSAGSQNEEGAPHNKELAETGLGSVDMSPSKETNPLPDKEREMTSNGKPHTKKSSLENGIAVIGSEEDPKSLDADTTRLRGRDDAETAMAKPSQKPSARAQQGDSSDKDNELVENGSTRSTKNSKDIHESQQSNAVARASVSRRKERDHNSGNLARRGERKQGTEALPKDKTNDSGTDQTSKERQIEENTIDTRSTKKKHRRRQGEVARSQREASPVGNVPTRRMPMKDRQPGSRANRRQKPSYKCQVTRNALPGDRMRGVLPTQKPNGSRGGHGASAKNQQNQKKKRRSWRRRRDAVGRRSAGEEARNSDSSREDETAWNSDASREDEQAWNSDASRAKEATWDSDASREEEDQVEWLDSVSLSDLTSRRSAGRTNRNEQRAERSGTQRRANRGPGVGRRKMRGNSEEEQTTRRRRNRYEEDSAASSSRNVASTASQRGKRSHGATSVLSHQTAPHRRAKRKTSSARDISRVKARRTLQKYPDGTEVWKEFANHGVYHGILHYRKKTGRYRVHYDDDDKEDLSEDEVAALLAK